MIRKLNETDRHSLLKYLEKDPHINLFFIGDILAFGFDDRIQTFYGHIKNNELVGVMMIYDGFSLHLFADEIDDSFIDYIKMLYSESRFSSINIGQETYDKLKGRLNSIIDKTTKTMLSVYYPNDLHIENGNAVKLNSKFVAEVQRIQDEIFSIKRARSFDQVVKSSMREVEAGVRHMYGVLEDNKLVSVATVTALTPFSGMIVGVGTIDAERKKGYATQVVKKLSDDLFREGRHGVLFYDNPNAARIYERLGYTPYSTYYMIEMKK